MNAQAKREAPGKKGKDGSEEDPQLRKVAIDGWDEAKCDMFNPAVPDPVISFSSDYKEPFYIDIRDWTVHLNLAQSPSLDEKILHKFTRSISHHELGHYTICPYDGTMNGLMLQAAQRVIGQVHAPVACNIVSDLIIEQSLAKRFNEITKWRFDESLTKITGDMKSQAPSDTWKLIVASESLAMNMDIPPAVKKAVDFKDVMADAKKIAKLIDKSARDTNAWPALVDKVSRILKPYLAQDFPVLVTIEDLDPSSGWRDVPGEEGTFVKIPVDVLEQCGDVSKTSDKDNGRMNEKSLKRSGRGRGRGRKGKEQQEGEGVDPRILIELAKHAKNIGEFGGPAVNMGLIRKEHVLAAWYRARAAGLIRVDIKTLKNVGAMPISPTTWRLGDAVESLDLTLTLLNSPIIIPNRTTMRWDFAMQTGEVPEKHFPDFLIVIDSSGSMHWKPDAPTDAGKGPYDIALVAGFAAVHFARKKGIQLAAINFSGSHRTCDWTKDVDQVEKIMLEYEGDGTVLPTREVIKLAVKNGKPTLIFIISDAGLYDWQAEMTPLTALMERRHRIVFFLIGGRASDLHEKRFVDFTKVGGRIYCIHNIHDLIGMVVDEVKRTYAPEEKDADLTPTSTTGGPISQNGS
nr:VWA domain-containing protein [Candidatus Sigynarchaeota archaeon]